MSFDASISKGLERALHGFLTEPNNQEATNAVYSGLITMMEIECRRLVASNMKLAVADGKAQVTLEGPLAQVLRDLFGMQAVPFDGSVTVVIPGWSPPTEEDVIAMTRPYIDPKSKRPTRGRPQL